MVLHSEAIECRERSKNDENAENQSKIDATLAKLKVTPAQLSRIRDRLHTNVLKGLKKKTREGNDIAMLPTFVESVPNGSEQGDFLALDLGGTNFRVVRVQLPGKTGGKVRVFNQVYKVPQSIMVGTATELFDHIAKCIVDFLEDHKLQDRKLPLGFTFSFPCVQKGLAKSYLMRWTKGFNVSGVVGEDLVKLLQDALKRQRDRGKKCSVDVVAVINDTVGTLMSCAFEDQNCSIGMVVGTGTNACYMESMKDMEFLEEEFETPQKLQTEVPNVGPRDEMCINTEWGGFGEDGSLDAVRTPFDENVDSISMNPGSMIYEKMISGLYLGDIVQQVLIHLVQIGALFEGNLTEELQKIHNFPSSFLTQIELDRSPELKMCGQILNNLGYPSTTLWERRTVRDVCSSASSRAANLCAAGVSALVERLKVTRASVDGSPLKITVAVDGTLYKKHPTFKHILNLMVHELSPLADVTFRLSHDGSGKGAALVSAVACRMSKTRTNDSGTFRC